MFRFKCFASVSLIHQVLLTHGSYGRPACPHAPIYHIIHVYCYFLLLTTTCHASKLMNYRIPISHHNIHEISRLVGGSWDDVGVLHRMDDVGVSYIYLLHTHSPFPTPHSPLSTLHFTCSFQNPQSISTRITVPLYIYF